MGSRIAATATYYDYRKLCHEPYSTVCKGLARDPLYAAYNGAKYGSRLSVSHGSRAVTVTVLDTMPGAPGTRKKIDLSPTAFAAISPLGAGRIDVVITPLGKKISTNPGGSVDAPADKGSLCYQAYSSGWKTVADDLVAGGLGHVIAIGILGKKGITVPEGKLSDEEKVSLLTQLILADCPDSADAEGAARALIDAQLSGGTSIVSEIGPAAAATFDTLGKIFGALFSAGTWVRVALAVVGIAILLLVIFQLVKG